MFKIKRLLFTPLFLSLISSSLHADELPERLYGSWQFTGTAGEAVIGELTITKDYVAYGSSLNGVCSDSYKVKRLKDDNDYPDNYGKSENELGILIPDIYKIKHQNVLLQ